jgi:hypothetical protein
MGEVPGSAPVRSAGSGGVFLLAGKGYACEKVNNKAPGSSNEIIIV